MKESDTLVPPHWGPPSSVPPPSLVRLGRKAFVIRLDAEILGRVEDPEGLNDFFRRLDLDPVVVHFVKDLAELLGRLHRDDPFAVFVSFGNHLYTP